MKLGVLTVPLGDRSVDNAFDYLSGLGVEAVELGTGGYPGSDHLDRPALLDDPGSQHDFLDTVAAYDLEISALAVHNNPLHPDEERAAEADRELRETIDLAGQLDVGTVTCFSGLPAGGPNDEVPNWMQSSGPTTLASGWTSATRSHLRGTCTS